LANQTAWAQAENRTIGLIIPRAREYHRELVGPRGWIARAAAFDYPSPAQESAPLPEEFYSLVGFINYCARRFPRQRPALAELPARAWHLLGRRYRSAHA